MFLCVTSIVSFRFGLGFRPKCMRHGTLWQQWICCVYARCLHFQHSTHQKQTNKPAATLDTTTQYENKFIKNKQKKKNQNLIKIMLVSIINTTLFISMCQWLWLLLMYIRRCHAPDLKINV